MKACLALLVMVTSAMAGNPHSYTHETPPGYTTTDHQTTYTTVTTCPVTSTVTYGGS